VDSVGAVGGLLRDTAANTSEIASSLQIKGRGGVVMRDAMRLIGRVAATDSQATSRLAQSTHALIGA